MGASADGDRSVRTEAFDAMATGEWELAPGMWQETELLLWKPPTVWFSINAFYTSAGMRNWYVNFEHPARRTPDGFDTLDLTVDLVVAPDLSRLTWKDEDEYAHVRRLGIITDTEHQAVDDARAQVLTMIEEHSGPFADGVDVLAMGCDWARAAPAVASSHRTRMKEEERCDAVPGTPLDFRFPEQRGRRVRWLRRTIGHPRVVILAPPTRNQTAATANGPCASASRADGTASGTCAKRVW
ncbi:DUF402 domain-containing protein [Streptomyces sp. NPDC059466]|uniref:DUF402 domain-containing protein n=1 Tax=unclassified Streptomyces TaxID=2593676 RepID=UPI00368508AA